jgi:hypothetical protein
MLVSQIDLVAGIIAHLAEEQGVETMTQRQMNSIIVASTDITNAFDRDDILATKGMGLSKWLASDDTGLSSCFVAGAITQKFVRQVAYPFDADDFGRIIRMFEAIDEPTSRISELAGTCPEWNELIKVWPQAEKEYREGGFQSCDLIISTAIRNL